MADDRYHNSRRFLNAFIVIEQALEKIVQNKSYKPFYQLVDAGARIDPFVQDISIELKEYGDLRNAIVHERINDEPIAEPHYEVVLRLEKIGDLLQSPPKVEEHFIRKVVTCSCDEPLSEAAKKMLEFTFSKLPVYRDQKFVGILTAEAITYWMADRLQTNQSLTHQKVDSVLKYIDNPDNYHFVSRATSLFEVLRIFDDYDHQGKRLQAILISEDGSEDTTLAGIITVFDFPTIYSIID